MIVVMPVCRIRQIPLGKSENELIKLFYWINIQASFFPPLFSLPPLSLSFSRYFLTFA